MIAAFHVEAQPPATGKTHRLMGVLLRKYAESRTYVEAKTVVLKRWISWFGLRGF